MEQEAKKKSWWTFDNLALIILAVGLFLVPVFSLSVLGFSVEISKRLLLALVASVAFVLWLLGRLQEGKLILPKNYIVAGAFAVTAVSALSAIFSKSFWPSFAGLGFESDTVLSFLVLSLLVFLVGVYFQSRQRFLTAYIGIFVVALVFFVLEFLALIILKTSWLGFAHQTVSLLFNGMSVSLLGKWYDFGIYAGFTLLSSLIMLEFFSLQGMKLFKNFIIACFVASLVALAFINYLPVWIFLGLASLIIFVYKISFWSFGPQAGTEDGENKTKKHPGQNVFLPSFLIIIVALLFITVGGADKLGRNISSFRDWAGVPTLEVKPSWMGTWDIAKKTLRQDPVFGAGPSRFVNEWVKFKPTPVNQTPFWNIDFRFGVGFVPTQLINTGILGLLAWLFFFASILYYGVRFIFNPNQDKGTRALLMLSFFGSVYLWTFAIISVPDTGLISLAFLVTGLFVAILTDTKIIKNKELSLTSDPRLSFVSILLFVVLIIGSIVASYLVVQKYVSLYAYQQGQSLLARTGDLEGARAKIAWASSLSRQDLYYRNLSEIDVALAGRLLSDETLPKEELRLRFLSQVELAINDAKMAKDLDPLNYLNWLALGRVYDALVPLGIDRTYELSQEAFKQGQALNPTNPAILLDYFARLEINKKNLSKAKEYVNQSLKIKENYSQAVSLLSQIDIQEGNPDVATRRLEEFIAVYPQYADAGLYFQLGYLKYQDNAYDQASVILGRAVALVPNFSNAKYFLGLSLLELGEREAARRQFEDIASFNPDNEEVKQILSRLRSGQAVSVPKVEDPDTATSTAEQVED